MVIKTYKCTKLSETTRKITDFYVVFSQNLCQWTTKTATRSPVGLWRVAVDIGN
jgi:hypothetical protein